MFKIYNYEELLRRIRRLLDGKFSYRKLFVIIVISCLFFLWILSKLFFYPSPIVKGNIVVIFFDEEKEIFLFRVI